MWTLSLDMSALTPLFFPYLQKYKLVLSQQMHRQTEWWYLPMLCNCQLCSWWSYFSSRIKVLTFGLVLGQTSQSWIFSHWYEFLHWFSNVRVSTFCLRLLLSLQAPHYTFQLHKMAIMHNLMLVTKSIKAWASLCLIACSASLKKNAYNKGKCKKKTHFWGIQGILAESKRRKCCRKQFAQTCQQMGIQSQLENIFE